MTTSPINDLELSRLVAGLESFSRAWNESPVPPVINDYLGHCSGEARDSLIIELIKIDLEARWQRGLCRVIEDYLAEFPDIQRLVTPHLILEEFRARKLAGDDVLIGDYFVRFPDLADSIGQLAGIEPLVPPQSANSEIAFQQKLEPGETIDDFDLLLVLGKGAFAQVFLARQRSMQRIVAVKVSSDKGDEPQMLAQLDHNNIIRVYDQRSVPDRGLRLLYMQYASGGTLGSVIQYLRTFDRRRWNGEHYLLAINQSLVARGESPPESAVRKRIATMDWPHVVCWLMTQLSQALDYAHRQRILHRDLKPSNVLLTAEGIPKLADFNISFSENLEGATADDNFGGSPAYMSPEQLEACHPEHARTAGSLDGRSDLYSLGVLGWELMTAELPFLIEPDSAGRLPSLQRMIEDRQQCRIKASPQTTPHASEVLEILRRCLAPRPEDRFQSGLELSRELEMCLQPESRELLKVPRSGWRFWARRFPVTTITMLTLIPNLLAAIFNFLHNHREIIDRMPAAEPTFMRVQAIINAIAFPTGIFCAAWLSGSVAKATRAISDSDLSVMELTAQRRRCLDLGNLAAIVGLALWLVAAPIYPISLHLILGNVPVELYLNFLASLAICGLIAAAYPFFAVSVVAVCCFYPSLIRWDSMKTDDRLLLERLMNQTWLYLVLAACVPMVAVVILAVAEPDHPSALIVLATSGAFGFGIAVSAFRILQKKIAILIRAIWREEN